MKKIYRTLGNSEKLSKIINYITPHNIVVTGLINRKLSEVLLRKALLKIQDNNPLLCCQIQNLDKFVYIESSSISIVKVNEALSPQDIVEKLINLQLDSKDLPLIKLYFMQKTNQSSIFLVAQHTISDGVSLVSIFLELLEVLDKMISSKNFSEFRKKNIRLSLEEYINENLAKNNKFLLNKRVKKIIQNKSACSCLKLSKKLTNKLFLYSNKNGTKITGTISALLIRALSFNMEKENDLIYYNVMVNMRKFLSSNTALNDNDLGFYSGCLPLVANNVDNTDFKTLSLKCSSDIKSALQNNLHIDTTKEYKNLLESSRSFKEFANKIKIDKPSVGISNMGLIKKLNLSNFNLVDIHVACSCNAYSYTENTFFVCITTYDNHFYLNFLYPNPIFSKARMKKIISTFKLLIKENC